MPGTGSCSDGFEYTQGDRCHDIGAYTTCCVPYGSKEGNPNPTGETENIVNEYSNGVAVAVCIFSAINTALLVLFLLFGECCCRKKADSNVESQGLLLNRGSGFSQIESNNHSNNGNARLPIAKIVTRNQNPADHRPSRVAISGDAKFSAKPI